MAQYREEQQQHHVTRNFYHQQRLRTATATMNGNYSALFFKSKSNQHTLNYINLNYWRQYCNYLPLIFRELLFNNYLLSRNNQRATTITTTVGEFSSSEQPWINFNFFLSPVATMQARQHRRNGLEILPLLDIYGTKPQQQHDLSPSTLSTSSSGVLSVDDHNNKSSTNKVPLSSFAIKHGNSGNNLDNIKNDGNNDKNNDNNSNSRSEFERRLSTTALTKAYFNTNLKRQKLEQKENIEKLVAEKLLVKDSAEQHQYFILNNSNYDGNLRNNSLHKNSIISTNKIKNFHGSSKIIENHLNCLTRYVLNFLFLSVNPMEYCLEHFNHRHMIRLIRLGKRKLVIISNSVRIHLYFPELFLWR